MKNSFYANLLHSKERIPESVCGSALKMEQKGRVFSKFCTFFVYWFFNQEKFV